MSTASLTGVAYDDVINAIQENLPCLPQILEELIKRLSDIESSIESIEELVRMDQAISARILKVSNKVEFVEPDESRITSIHDALHKIGLENAKRISLNVSVLNLMENVDYPRCFKFLSLWQHSLGVAVASSVLSDFTGYENPDQAYSCGLVHDIGKLIKIQYDGEGFCEEIKSANEGKLNLNDNENLHGFLNHATLGSFMMAAWEMPYELATVIRWHHIEDRSKREQVESKDMHHLIDIVCLANLLTNKLEIGHSGHNIVKMPCPELLERFGIDEDKLLEIEKKILESYEENSGFLSNL